MSKNFKVDWYLLSEFGSWQSERGGEYGINDKGAVVHELVRGEGGHSVEELLGCCFKVAHHECIQALVDFESVSSVPVTAFFDQTFKTETFLFICTIFFLTRK